MNRKRFLKAMGKGLVLSVAALCVACSGGSKTKPITLLAPTTVSATDGTFPGKVVVSWDAVANAKSYAVYRSESAGGSFAKVDTTSDTTWDDLTTTFQKDYYYKVATISSTNTEGLQSTSVDSGYRDYKAGISSLSASNGTSADKVVLTWGISETSGSYTYKVFRSDDGAAGTYNLIGEPTATTYEDSTNLVAGKMYYYKVQDVSVKGAVGDLSNYDNGYIPFTTPTGLSASKGTNLSSVDLTWTAVNAAASYNLYSSTTDGQFTSVLSSPVAATFSDTAPEEGVSTYYAVEAVSADGIASVKTASVSGYKGVTKPANVQAASGKSYTKISVSWTAVTGASSYNIYRSVNGGAYSTTALTSTANSYVDTDVVSGATYTYKVSAVKNGKDSGVSDESNAGSVLASSASRTVTLNWTANREKAVNRTGGGYVVEYSKASDFSGALSKTVNYSSGAAAPTTTTIDFDSTQKGTWYFRIKAFSNIGSTSSAYSAAGTIVID